MTPEQFHDEAMKLASERMRIYAARMTELYSVTAALSAHLRRLSEVEVEGWVMVPRTPTPEMLSAAVESREGPAIYKVLSAGGLATCEREAADDYAAMLAAAPAQPTPTPEGE